MANLDILPTELIYDIMQRSKTSTAMSLSLVSRRLHHKAVLYLGWPYTCTEQTTVLEMLQYLVRDNPELHLCKLCVKLHRPGPPEFADYTMTICKYDLRVCEKTEGIARFGDDFALFFHEAQAAVRQAQASTNRGVALEVLKSCDKTRYPLEKIGVTACVAAGLLLIQTRYQNLLLEQGENPFSIFRLAYICPHLPEEIPAEIVDELTFERGNQAALQFSCQFCPTDVIIVFETMESHASTTYIVKSFRDLGPCNSPTSLEWTRQTKESDVPWDPRARDDENRKTIKTKLCGHNSQSIRTKYEGIMSDTDGDAVNTNDKSFTQIQVQPYQIEKTYARPAAIRDLSVWRSY